MYLGPDAEADGWAGVVGKGCAGVQVGGDGVMASKRGSWYLDEYGGGGSSRAEGVVRGVV